MIASAKMITVYRLAADAALHAKLFFGFSTKGRDPESEFLYYGHRYYNPIPNAGSTATRFKKQAGSICMGLWGMMG